MNRRARRDPWGRQRRGGGSLLASLLFVIVLAVFQIFHHVTPPTGAGLAPLSGFGGYTWSGDVTTISAAWTVPTIAAHSLPGDASTWIGAQNSDGEFPFIQLGTTEDSFGPFDQQYEAFWSTTSVAFHPQDVLPCSAGDHVTASMERNAQGWLLRFADLSARTHKKLEIYYGASGDYTQGEWLQEDPTGSFNAAVDLPYPTMTVTTFDHVTVNGSTPQLTLDDGQTLSATRHIYRVPTAVHDGSFSFRVPTGPTAQYLADVAPLESATAAFNVDYVDWSSLSARRRTADILRLSAAYAATSRRVPRQSWPAAAQFAVAPFARELRLEAASIKSWTAVGVDGMVVQNLSSGPASGVWADRLRRSLHLPPL